MQEIDVYCPTESAQHIEVLELGLAIPKIGTLTDEISLKCVEKRPGLFVGFRGFRIGRGAKGSWRWS
jgi:hypothetical protein